uniref:Oxidoreductase family protein n=1 Tax=Rhizophora mucronata TaxID=61149 RepID=A0A2P2JZT6_RHIMU
MGEIDPAFIQDPEYRPELKPIEPDEIPVISLSVSSPSDIERILSEIGDACQKWGFFQVINHGVSLELRQKVEKLAKEFFNQPLEEKLKVKRNEVYPVGYYDGEHTKNVRDWKEVFDFLLKDSTMLPVSFDPDDKELRTLTNQWPEQYPPEFREVCQEYAREVSNLGYKLFELVSQGLGLPADRLIGYFKDQLSLCRLNYYPPCPAPHLALGVGRHKDATALTILFQDDVGGLEVKRKSDGEWIPVRPFPGAYIINVGDVLQVTFRTSSQLF